MDAMNFETFAQATNWGLPLSGSALQVGLVYLVGAVTALTCFVAADRAEGRLQAPVDEAHPGDGEPTREPAEARGRSLDDPGDPRDEDGRGSLSRMSLTAEDPSARDPRAELSRLGLLMPSVDDPGRRGPA
ncbi:hypothetical protein [Tautonia plasticadhaerens]|uniref:Uncharacterized protein n=1 Tax=Tautonia plasticadhaerens TaxID=2527974 RepID=A0A518H4Q8_9BACT|nr:hypothetical protein [Tautonia plasticadhaerens]QDV35822.1 hypothetical protein ElP_37300 [Tautonia plasticadhaerens]